jgi:outer membrane protein assembly factor BamB
MNETRHVRRLGTACVVVAASIAAGTLIGCGGTTKPAANSHQPAATHIQDVGDYRGGPSRTGVLAGPGLPARRQLWRVTSDIGIGWPVPVASGTAFVPTSRGVSAVDVRTGAMHWSVPIGVTADSPLVTHESTMFAVTNDGVLHAIDVRTRAELWRHSGIAQGAQVTPYGGAALVGERNGRFVALDLATGRTQWRVRTGSSAVKDAVGGGAAYVGASFGSRLVAVDLATHRVRWSYDAHSQRLVTPSYAYGVVYLASIGVGGSVLHALDSCTGRLKWQFTVPGHAPVASFVVDEHGIYIGTEGVTPGRLYAVSRTDGSVQWSAPIRGNVDRPVLVSGVLYVASGTSGLHAFDPATGHELWNAPVPGYAEGVTVTGGIGLVVAHGAGDAPGTVTAFGAPWR